MLFLAIESYPLVENLGDDILHWHDNVFLPSNWHFSFSHIICRT